jgi:glycosyl transferase family 25
MRAFIINLDSAADRWAFTEASFGGSRLILCRVQAVDGKVLQLPHAQYSEKLYRWFHGRTPNVRELACYLSHLKAIETFLATDEKHALIGEDDLVLRPDFDAAIAAAMQYVHSWNILRVTGLSRGRPARLVPLFGDYSLCVSLGRLKGAGAYVIDRAAATAFLARLMPMRLPYDHAFDREWVVGLRAAYITPFPASQSESPFLSSVQPGTYPKLSWTRRCLTTYPYQACNEIARWHFRAAHYLSFKLRRLVFPERRGSTPDAS